MEKHYEWLGWRARDRVTGFEGIVSHVGRDLYGCVQGTLTPVVTTKDGAQHLDVSHWFDLTRLEKVGPERVMQPIQPREADAPGGFDKPSR